ILLNTGGGSTDLNGDGVVHDRLHGKRIRTVFPTATLPDLGSQDGQEGAEGDLSQEAIETNTWNEYGQLTSTTNAEENTTVFLYHPEDDPDGDGSPTPLSTTGGYRRQ